MATGSSSSMDDAVAEEPSSHEKRPARGRFSFRKDQPRLSAEQAARQGRVVSCALRSLPAGAAMTFLNTDHAGLGRPLDLAIESAAGLAMVEEALAAQAAKLG